MKSGLAKLGRPRNAGPPVPMGTASGFYSMSAMAPTDDEALMRAYSTQGTVYSNISMLASSTAGPTWKMFRKDPNPGRGRYTTNDQGSDQRQEITKHQALNVLNKPASMIVKGNEIAVFTRFSLFEISQTWLDLTGKCYWVVDRNPASPIPLGLWPVRPDRLKPVPDPKNWLAGWVYTAPDGREKIPLDPDEVIFNRYPDPLDTYGGCGPVQSVLVDIQAARYSAEWNRNFFINGARPDGVLQTDEKLDDDEYNTLMMRWRDAHRGVARAHRVAMLEAGVTYIPVASTMKDMDFANLRESSRDIIREALGMHKVMTGVTDDVNRANAQTGEEVFANWKVSPRLDRWRDVLNFQYLPLFGSTSVDVELDYVYPTPQNREQDNAELTAKCASWAQLVDSGADPDAAADVVGLPRMPMIEKPPPGGLPVGTPGAGEGVPAAPAQDDADAVAAAMRRALSMVPSDDRRRAMAALNMAAAA